MVPLQLRLNSLTATPNPKCFSVLGWRFRVCGFQCFRVRRVADFFGGGRGRPGGAGGRGAGLEV